VILVAGLGNPGARYEGTRHNAGFLVVDELFRRAEPPATWREKLSGLSAVAEIAGHRSLLLKPQTLMNRSGNCVGPTLAFYKLPPEGLLVVHDELDLPLGQIRLKMGGGDAGHNGLRSITGRLGTGEYGRLRFGIGRPPPDFEGDTASYVLEGFAPTERADLQDLVGNAADAVTLVVRAGLDAAMNQVNRRTRS
jgi:PTH1 family peptidyl-tRNA hydrolase